MSTTLRFATDDDVIALDPRVEGFFPRADPRTGALLRDWDVQHGQGMAEIERRMRVKRVAHGGLVSGGVFEIGRLGLRSREHLRRPAAAYTLHYIYVAADTQGDPNGYFYQWAQHWLKRAHEWFEAEATALDYDEGGDDEIGDDEKQRPFPAMVIRG